MDDNKKFWDRFAGLYEPIQQRTNRRLYEQIADHCRPYITPQTKVLELCCGSGQLTLPLYRQAADWEATDFSEPMLAQTRRRCPQVRTSCQDATDLHDPDASFDVVLIGNSLHIMPDPQRAMAEIRRVLKPEGIVLAPTFVYEGKVNRVRMWLTTQLGFRTFHEWNRKELEDFIMKAGFSLLESQLLPGDPLPVAFVAAGKTRSCG